MMRKVLVGIFFAALCAKSMVACDRSIDPRAAAGKTMSDKPEMVSLDQKAAELMCDAFKDKAGIVAVSVMNQFNLRLYVTRTFYSAFILDTLSSKQFMIDAVRLMSRTTKEKEVVVNLYVSGLETRVAMAESDKYGEITVRLAVP